MKINSKKFNKINIIYDNLGSEISYPLPTKWYNQSWHHVRLIDVGEVHVFRKLLTEEIVQKAKILAQTIIYDEKLKKNYLSTRVSLYKNLKPKSSMLFSPDPDSLAEELKWVHLRCYVWINALTATLT